MRKVQNTGDGRNLNLKIEKAEAFRGVELVAPQMQCSAIYSHNRQKRCVACKLHLCLLGLLIRIVRLYR